MTNLADIVDLDRWPVDRLAQPEGRDLVARCRDDLATNGLFNLEGFLRPDAITGILAGLVPTLADNSFNHARRHNIYFKKEVPGLAPDHPLMTEFETSNDTICADQFDDNPLFDLYRWPAIQTFLAQVMDKPVLHPMDDMLACANVMSYRAGQALNWHFDRSEFTTTLLLQAPDRGGDFQYSKDLRADDNPNYPGVLRLLQGEDDQLRVLRLQAGTLNVFRGKNTPHRVTPIEGEKARIMAVFSYFETPGKRFTDEENIGFYGRAS